MTILHFRFPSQYELASTFLRFQEYYESSFFKDKVFTHEEYFDWYAKEYGDMTYFSDWSGFNLPDTAFSKFLSGFFDPLWSKEKKLLTCVRDVERPFYIIGTYQNIDIVHEVVHGLFYIDLAYRSQVQDAVASFDEQVREPLFKALAKKGYNKSVIVDETNAFSVANPPNSDGFRAWLPKEEACEASLVLGKIFSDWFGFDPLKEPGHAQQYVESIEWGDV